MKPEKEISVEEMLEVFRQYKIGLYDLARFFIAMYPENIFKNKPNEIVIIRKCFEKILEDKEVEKWPRVHLTIIVGNSVR